MNLMARLRLVMSRFTIPKGYHKTLEILMTNASHGIYNFQEDGVIISTSKRKSTDEPILATVRAERLLDKYPIGIAVTIDGATILQDASMSKGLVEVVRFINAWNKEIYASRNEKARRNNPNRRNDKGNNSAD